MMIKGEAPTSINGKDFWTLRQFSYFTERSDSAIRYLYRTGNRVRKLQVSYFGGTPFIPVEELFDFPFVARGRSNSNNKTLQTRFFLNPDGVLSKREEEAYA